MTDAQDFKIAGSYNNQRVSEIDAERSVNVFEYIDPLGKKERSLINTSGLLNGNFNFGAATGGFRAQFVFQGNHYVVIGSSVIRITPSGTVSLLGTLINSFQGYVGVDGNTFQILFVDGQDGYIWDNNATTFTRITDTSFPPNPIDCCALDGFFVVAQGNTNNFQLSEFNQGMIWGPSVDTFTGDSATSLLTLGSTANYQTGVSFTLSTTGALPSPLNSSDTYFAIRVSPTTIRVATTYQNAITGSFITLLTNGTPTNTITSTGQLQQGQITSHPGNIVACRTLHRRLFLFSEFFTEVWENAGIGTNLPFRRNNSLLMEYGTPCLGSISSSFDMMIFISQARDGIGPVMQVLGTQAIPISTRALDFQLSQYYSLNQISDCRAFLVKENGLIFYRMNFTEANHTFVYDVTLSNPAQDETKLWHEEEVLNGDRHPAQTHATFNGLNYVGDYKLPILYELDSGTFTNNGETIRRMRITAPVTPPGYQRIRIDRLQVDVLQGNVAQIGNTDIVLDLLTESAFDILTESGDTIEAEQLLVIAQPIQPYIFLSISKDGGQTYGYIQRAPMGKVGQRTFRTLWRKLGTTKRGQSFVCKFEFFDHIPFVILGASWAFEILPE